MRKNLRISFLGAGARYVLQAASIVILSRLLSPADFGVVAAAMIGVSFSFVVLQIGGSAIVASAKEAEVEKAFTVAMYASVVIALFFTVLYFVFEQNILAFLRIESVYVIRVLLLVVLMRGVIGAIEGLYSARYEFSKLAKAEVLSYFFGYFLVSVMVAYLTHSYWALIVGVLAQSVLHFAFLAAKVSRCFQAVSLDDFKTHLAVGGGMMINKVIAYGTSQSDNLYINGLLGKQELGVYSRAYQLMVIPTNFVGQVVGRVFIPSFREEVRVYRKYQLINMLLSVLTVALIFAFGEKGVLYVLGDGWDGVYEVLLVLGLAIYYRIDFKFIESVLIAKRKTKELACSNLSGLLLIVVCLLFFKPAGLEEVAVLIYVATFLQVMVGSSFSISYLGVSRVSTLLINIAYFVFSLMMLASIG